MYATNHLHPRLSRAIRAYCKANNLDLGMTTIEMKESLRDRVKVLEAYVILRDWSLKDIHTVTLQSLMETKKAPILGTILDLWDILFHK